MKYTLMVEATTDDDPPQYASDIVGPILLTNEPATCKCINNTNSCFSKITIILLQSHKTKQN